MGDQLTQSSILVNIKRRAKAIKKASGLQHSLALDEAAVEAGFQNFRHAQNAFCKAALSPIPKHGIKLSTYWYDATEGVRGKESLSIELSQAWGDIIRPAQINHSRRLGGFRIEANNHLFFEDQLNSKSDARTRLCKAARTFLFMDATGLRPSSGASRAYPAQRDRDSYRIPGQDHAEVWFDSKKRYLISDEPYEPSAVQNEENRKQWIARYGYDMRKPEWPGMYNSDGDSRLYLFSKLDKGVPLDPIVNALNKLPPVHDSPWTGETSKSPAFGRSTGHHNKLDLLLFETITTHINDLRAANRPLVLNLQSILSALGYSDAEPELRGKLRRIEVSGQVIDGLKITTDNDGVVRLI